ncbi:hypothetical protein PINS_up001354 [Pythium insidiosum]|nr:hypothetical protein PINS_up001354 [Pythium insidiosum]
MEHKLQQLAEDTKRHGAKLIRAFTAVAIVGCVRFLRGFYFVFVTQRRKIGCIGGNFIYGISATQQLSVSAHGAERPGAGAATAAWSWLNRWLNPNPEEEAEARYLGLFHFVDLTKDFYFSYSYDVTRSLQANMTGDHKQPAEMFVWNEYLTRDMRSCLSDGAASDLIIPLVMGCYEQRKCSVFGRLVSMTLLARRSRHYAGTRYLKRGVADTGMTANDVETEQIVEDENMGVGKFSSYVQYRGSIPVFWSQETSATLPKPPIVLNRIDPTYAASRKHFADLFSRYGSPILALNLIKHSEKKAREGIVGNEFMNAVEYLNCFIPAEHRIRYVALDFSRLGKLKALSVLDKVAIWALSQTGFFCSAPKRQIEPLPRSTDGQRTDGPSGYVSFAAAMSPEVSTGSDEFHDRVQGASSLPEDHYSRAPRVRTIPRGSDEWLEQRGVLRTNCIDCLDRTNVSQFNVGMRALGLQLYAMGIRNTPVLESQSEIVKELVKLYSAVGDAISMQYGGSEAHKNVKNSGGRENVKHRELLTSIRRYYSNSFTDMAKQDAINVFLGHYVPREGEPPLWELESDYYLHNFEVHNGRVACDAVRDTLERQAESKRTAIRTVPSTAGLSGLDTEAGESTSSEANLKEDMDGPQSKREMTVKEKRRREAYIQECKRLWDDWWITPLSKFDSGRIHPVHPKSSVATSHPASSSTRESMKQSVTDEECHRSADTDEKRSGSSQPLINRPRKSTSVSSDTFLQMYHPEELTSFDKTLGYKFMKAVDISRDSTGSGGTAGSSGGNSDYDRTSRSRLRSTASSLDASSSNLGADLLGPQSKRSASIDDDGVFADTTQRRPTGRGSLTTRNVRAMSAPDIGDELARPEQTQRRPRRIREDESEYIPAPTGDHSRISFAADDRPSNNAVPRFIDQSPHGNGKSSIKRREDPFKIRPMGYVRYNFE